MKVTKRKILRFLIIRSELWFRFILVVTTMMFISTNKLLLSLTAIIGLLWVMNGWRLSLEAYKEGSIIPEDMKKTYVCSKCKKKKTRFQMNGKITKRDYKICVACRGGR